MRVAQTKVRASREMGTTMAQSKQLGLAVGLFAAATVLLTAPAAWAFTRENVSPGDGGNYNFTDPAKPDPENRNFGQSSKPFGSSGPVVQFGVQQGPFTTFGRSNGYNTTPDPYYRSLTPGN
jgi:hypothetical protein